MEMSKKRGKFRITGQKFPPTLEGARVGYLLRRRRVHQSVCDRMPRMKFASTLLWALLAVLGAIAIALVTGLVRSHEKVNGLWLVVAAGCIFVLAYRFYGRWLARRVLEL